jgi:cytochrome c
MKTINKILLTLVVIGSLTAVSATDGAMLYKKCSACHGATAEKKALGKSAIIKGWEASKVVAALKGYKDGTYGSTMKGVMKAQVSSLDDTKIEALAKFIEAQK